MKLSQFPGRLLAKIGQTLSERIICFFPSRGTVYMFHDIRTEPPQDSFCISTVGFEQFVSSLRDKNPIPLTEWESHDRFVALTFDDVPVGFYDNAYPILERSGLPYTIFVSMDLLDNKGYISTSQLLEMASSDLCTVGSHGNEHVFYRNICSKEKDKYLKESKSKLEKLIGKPVELFAFPYGSLYACGISGLNKVKRYYRYGFCTFRSHITSPTLLPKFFLPRVNVSEGMIKLIK